MNPFLTPESEEAIRTLRREVPEAAAMLKLDEGMDIDGWTKVLDGKLLPMLSPDFPLLAAICGGGSSGKSTLFNSLVGKKVSPTGGRAGINRKVLVAAHERHFQNKEFLSFLFEPFGAAPEPLRDPSELTVPGPPVYISSKTLPPNLVLMDTPDFDTGSGGEYTNRGLARQALETADIFIYIFTNSNYNNRDNTDFIAHALTGIGKRHCFLVYRVYPSFSSEDVSEHAATVARNIYGDQASKYVLGVYRADEDNSVAAGEKYMQVYAVPSENPPFSRAMAEIDTGRQRRDLLRSIMLDATGEAVRFVKQGRLSIRALRLYLDSLKAAQSHCVQEALMHFPMDLVMKRFAEIWLTTDPGHIRAMRKTGEVVGFPFRMVMTAGKWARKKFSDSPETPEKEEYKGKVEEDLLTAVNSLYQKALADKIRVDLPASDPAANRMMADIHAVLGAAEFDVPEKPEVRSYSEKGLAEFSISAHPALSETRERLRGGDWRATVKSVLEKRELIVSFNENIDKELKVLVDQFRKKMGFIEKSRQTFSALLNVLPATAAVTYILATGDPVGATGIKIKLSGLFGLHDLYALVAIPATTGLNKADRNQLEALLGPIAKTWLNSKLDTVREIFEKEITGAVIRQGEQIISESEKALSRISELIETSKKGYE